MLIKGTFEHHGFVRKRTILKLKNARLRYNQSVYDDLNRTTAGARQSSFTGKSLIS